MMRDASKEQPLSMKDDRADDTDETGVVDAFIDKASADSSKPDVEHHGNSIEAENEIVGVRLLLIHIGTTLATFLAGLDSNLIATSIPVITSQFNSIGDVGWCASQPLAGKLYTLFSKKVVFLVYLFLFELGNLVCALTPSSNGLIAGSVATGLGAASIFVGGMVILATIIPLYKRVIWQGIQVSLFSVASLVGPIIGGSLTQRLTWRWCFWINLPFGGLAAVLLLLFLRIQKPDPGTHWPIGRKFKALDLVGVSLVASFMTMLLIALQFGGVIYPWSSSIIIGLFVGAGVTFILFVPWQIYRGDDALVPPKLFQYRNGSLLLIASMFAAGPFQVIVYWLPIWFQAVLGDSPLASGAHYLPTVIADALACLLGSAIIMQLGVWNPFFLLANALISLSGGLLSTIHPDQPAGYRIGYQVLGGVGFGLVNNAAHIGMQASVPKELVPIGASGLMATTSATCAIFLAAGQTIFQERLKANLSGKVSSGLIDKLLTSGATNIRSFVTDTQLATVVDGYSKSITQVFYLPAAAPMVGFLIALGLRWTSLKKGKTVHDKIDADERKDNSDIQV